GLRRDGRTHQRALNDSIERPGHQGRDRNLRRNEKVDVVSKFQREFSLAQGAGTEAENLEFLFLFACLSELPDQFAELTKLDEILFGFRPDAAEPETRCMTPENQRVLARRAVLGDEREELTKARSHVTCLCAPEHSAAGPSSAV